MPVAIKAVAKSLCGNASLPQPLPRRTLIVSSLNLIPITVPLSDLTDAVCKTRQQMINQLI